MPPGNWGGDPGHCRSINKLHWDTIQEFLHLLLSCQLNPSGEPQDNDSGRHLLKSRSSKMQVMAVDFEKDASKLPRLPCFQVDPRLTMEIRKVTRDI